MPNLTVSSVPVDDFMQSASKPAAANALGVPYVYATVEALIADVNVTAFTAGDAVQVNGYYAAGDFGPPMTGVISASAGFDASITSGTFGTDVGTTGALSFRLQDGRYFLFYPSERVNAKWFGAKGNGFAPANQTGSKLHDDRAALQGAINYVNSQYAKTRHLHIPKGAYNINSTISVSGNDVGLCFSWKNSFNNDPTAANPAGSNDVKHGLRISGDGWETANADSEGLGTLLIYLGSTQADSVVYVDQGAEGYTGFENIAIHGGVWGVLGATRLNATLNNDDLSSGGGAGGSGVIITQEVKADRCYYNTATQRPDRHYKDIELASALVCNGDFGSGFSMKLENVRATQCWGIGIKLEATTHLHMKRCIVSFFIKQAYHLSGLLYYSRIENCVFQQFLHPDNPNFDPTGSAPATGDSTYSPYYHYPTFYWENWAADDAIGTGFYIDSTATRMTFDSCGGEGCRRILYSVNRGPTFKFVNCQLSTNGGTRNYFETLGTVSTKVASPAKGGSVTINVSGFTPSAELSDGDFVFVGKREALQYTGWPAPYTDSDNFTTWNEGDLVPGHWLIVDTVGASSFTATRLNGAGSFWTYYDGKTVSSSTTQFNVTNPSGSTFRYTYNGTGTDPSISASTIRAGMDVTISGTNLNANNEGTFEVTGVGANYFEVSNGSGVAETDKTIGSGSIAFVMGNFLVGDHVALIKRDDIGLLALETAGTGDNVFACTNISWDQGGILGIINDTDDVANPRLSGKLLENFSSFDRIHFDTLKFSKALGTDENVVYYDEPIETVDSAEFSGATVYLPLDRAVYKTLGASQANSKNGITLDGATGYGETPDPTAFSVTASGGDQTIVFNTNAAVASGDLQCFYGTTTNAAGTVPVGGVGIYGKDGDAGMSVILRQQGLASTYYQVDFDEILDGGWKNITVVLSGVGTTPSVKMVVNGAEKTGTVVIAATGTFNDSATPLQHVFIGAQDNTPDRLVTGSMNTVYVYSSALSVATISTKYTEGSWFGDGTGLVAAYDMDEGVGVQVRDRTSNQRDILLGATGISWVTPQRVGYVRDFNLDANGAAAYVVSSSQDILPADAVVTRVLVKNNDASDIAAGNFDVNRYDGTNRATIGDNVPIITAGQSYPIDLSASQDTADRRIEIPDNSDAGMDDFDIIVQYEIIG